MYLEEVFQDSDLSDGRISEFCKGGSITSKKGAWLGQ